MNSLTIASMISSFLDILEGSLSFDRSCVRSFTVFFPKKFLTASGPALFVICTNIWRVSSASSAANCLQICLASSASLILLAALNRSTEQIVSRPSRFSLARRLLRSSAEARRNWITWFLMTSPRPPTAAQPTPWADAAAQPAARSTAAMAPVPPANVAGAAERDGLGPRRRRSSRCSRPRGGAAAERDQAAWAKAAVVGNLLVLLHPRCRHRDVELARVGHLDHGLPQALATKLRPRQMPRGTATPAVCS